MEDFEEIVVVSLKAIELSSRGWEREDWPPLAASDCDRLLLDFYFIRIDWARSLQGRFMFHYSHGGG